MPIKGTINSLYLDYEQTKPLFPRTKTKAVSDENGVGLDATLSKIQNDLSNKATESFVTNEIAKAQLGGGGGSGDIDLSGFATKDDISILATKEELTLLSNAIPTTPEAIGAEVSGAANNALNNAKTYVNEQINAIDYPVDSVNGKTGTVTLNASDVGARPNTWMPSASDVGAAPAGYGYGDEISCVFWNDSDGTLFENYIDTNILPRMAGNTIIQITHCVDYPANESSGNGGMAIVKKSSEGADALITFFGNGGLIAMKQKLTNVWYPWEYLNPRMQLGVEYRTTERWNGEAVYCITIPTGALPNTAEKRVPHGVSAKAIVRVEARAVHGTSGEYVSLPIIESSKSVSVYVVNANYIYIYASGDYSEWTSSYVTLYYTKN